jgi:1-deoxy-D-xylulose-5-phosphate synthase
MSLLDRIHSPADLKRLDRRDLPALAEEVRAFLIRTCAETGGHIGAGLGVVELTMALHYVFDTPTDQIVWDVGHQGYPHKVLTGRWDRFDTLRQEDGISGFLKRSESPYDTFGAGHAATAISAALGMAAARDVNGERFKVAAILGDGALTCGLAYEGLNNAGASDRDILDHPQRQRDVDRAQRGRHQSLPHVGAAQPHLQPPALQAGRRARSCAGGVAGRGQLVRKWEESMKSFLTPGVLFEELGFRYFGPIDGHDLDQLVDTLKAVRELEGPRFLHVITQKGRGFPAGEHVEKWHALPPGHDPSHGQAAQGRDGQPQLHRRVRGGAWPT